MTHLNGLDRDRLYTEEYRELIGRSVVPDVMAGPWRESSAGSLLDVMLDVDVQTYLPDDLLVKMDIATMASSLEARSPLLDHELMEFAASLPASCKLRGREKKVALRAALRGWVPDEILDAPKRGFRLPLADWFRGELARLCARRAARPAARSAAATFASDYVRSLVERHVGGFAGPLPGHLDAAHVRALAPGVRRCGAAGAPRRARGHREHVSRAGGLTAGPRTADPARVRGLPASAPQSA